MLPKVRRYFIFDKINTWTETITSSSKRREIFLKINTNNLDRVHKMLLFYNGWHTGQTRVRVLPVLMFSTVVPQTGQGWPSRCRMCMKR